jgi:hypothetical protein
LYWLQAGGAELQFPAPARQRRFPAGVQKRNCRSALHISKNRRASATQIPYYHVFMGMQNIFSPELTADHAEYAELENRRRSTGSRKQGATILDGEHAMHQG